MSIQLRDYSDRELLYLLRDMNGESDSRGVAAKIIGLDATLSLNEAQTERLKTTSRCVSSRFAWMRRFGLVERTEDKTWTISEWGKKLISARETTVSAGVFGASANSSLMLAHAFGEKLYGLDDVPATAVRREITYWIQRRKSR